MVICGHVRGHVMYVVMHMEDQLVEFKGHQHSVASRVGLCRSQASEENKRFWLNGMSGTYSNGNRMWMQ